ncbi:uncharacterized protein PHALS_12007 [Plasmopara halstedii]|uniref:Uncharacterized protein n=1 Tax=Plasmopara halstedii TaxID=4781 RepID=A0A0P1AK93_PLAHL|nr:uncharacterized protein PHALS_12007 [Plasmopara halstedii]CEG41670.1 hypothetical protein PHALS_12007 [Plasmopara halstedii]|eukprot:XP_024578039.1 hypothetical protein PHALS_12007 [Plasmopara halstedii]
MQELTAQELNAIRSHDASPSHREQQKKEADCAQEWAFTCSVFRKYQPKHESV